MLPAQPHLLPPSWLSPHSHQQLCLVLQDDLSLQESVTSLIYPRKMSLMSVHVQAMLDEGLVKNDSWSEVCLDQSKEKVCKGDIHQLQKSTQSLTCFHRLSSGAEGDWTQGSGRRGWPDKRAGGSLGGELSGCCQDCWG